MASLLKRLVNHLRIVDFMSLILCNNYLHIVLAIHFQGGLHMANEDTRSHSQEYNSARRDRLEGSMREAGGRVKESAGALADNERLKAEGERDQLAGTARRKKGSWKARIKAWIDRI
jgi:uncharacterized protein YjbJ (UPF0337 family)